MSDRGHTIIATTQMKTIVVEGQLALTKTQNYCGGEFLLLNVDLSYSNSSYIGNCHTHLLTVKNWQNFSISKIDII